MRSKEYLNKAYFLNRRIEKTQERIDNLICIVERCTPVLSDMPRSGNVENKNEELLCKVMELRQQSDMMIDELADMKERNRKLIGRLSDPSEKLLLELRYISFMQWSDIAAVLGCSERWVYKLHDSALSGLEIFFKKCS